MVRDLQPRKQRIWTEVCMACEGDLPSIELEDSKREALVDSAKIAINFVKTRKVWDYTLINLDDAFCFNLSQNLGNECDPTTVAEACSRSDWPMWEKAMRFELESLKSHKIFSPIEITPKGINPLDCKWVFVRKRVQFGNVSQYKARLVTQGFTQHLGIDYEETYSPMMNLITLRYLLSLAVDKKLKTRLMDVVTTYMYGSLDIGIYAKVPAGLVELQNSQRQPQCLKHERALYGLKHADRMWYKRLRDFLINQGFKNDEVCPCNLNEWTHIELVLMTVYVDDLNIIGTTYATSEIVSQFKGKNGILAKPPSVLAYRLKTL